VGLWAVGFSRNTLTNYSKIQRHPTSVDDNLETTASRTSYYGKWKEAQLYTGMTSFNTDVAKNTL